MKQSHINYEFRSQRDCELGPKYITIDGLKF